MNRVISEKDWKAFKVIQERVQDRACQAALVEAERLIKNPKKTVHDRFRDVCRFLRSEERAFDREFTDHRRSTALQMLLVMDGRRLLEEEDLMLLSEETRGLLLNFRNF